MNVFRKKINSCETDDGGPLVENLSGLSLLYGLIDYRSMGYCSRIITNRIGTYVDVSTYKDWIDEHKNSGGKMTYFPFLFFIILLNIF